MTDLEYETTIMDLKTQLAKTEALLRHEANEKVRTQVERDKYRALLDNIKRAFVLADV